MRVGQVRVLEAVVVQVVAREDRLHLTNRPPRDPFAGLCLAAATDRPETRPATRRRVVGPVERAVVLVKKIDPRAFGGEKACRLVDRELEHLCRIPEGGDPGADLTQGELGVGASLHLRSRAGELLDELRVGHRNRGVIGERSDEGDIVLVEGVGPARIRTKGAEDPVAGDQRRHEQ